MELSKFKVRIPVVEAIQFRREGQWPEMVKRWPNENRPRDASHGYVEIMGGKIHVWDGDWIVKKGDGWSVFRNGYFQEIYEPA